MGRRTWLKNLRAINVSLFALGILGASLISSLLHTRPASAEGFLHKTVECVLGALVMKDCREPAAPATPAQPATGQAASPASPTQSSTKAASESSKQVSSESANEVAQLDVTSVEPVVEAPELPTDTHRQPFAYRPAFYASVMYRTFGQAANDTPQNTPLSIQPSEEGWRIFGVAWYWWGSGIAGIVTAALLARRLKSKQRLSVVK